MTTPVRFPKLMDWLRRFQWEVFVGATLILFTAGIERLMGRSVFGTDGRFGWWEGNIWSNENSQRLLDPYTFSHVIHGLLLFAVLKVFAGGMPLAWRFVLAIFLESAWEVLENSPLIINRYRDATIALGYTGDSILNSIADIVAMSAGFLLAARAPTW